METPTEVINKASNVYELSKLSDFKGLSIKTSIDKIVLPFNQDYYKQLDKELRTVFTYDGNYRSKTEKNKMVIKYHNNELGLVNLVYSTKPSPYKLNSRLDVHEPNNYRLEVIYALFNTVGIESVSTSAIELAFDFYIDDYTDLFYLKEYIQQHLVHKYQRKYCQFFKDTFYTTKLGKTSKRGKVYLKPINSNIKDFLRVELTLYRDIIRKQNIVFPFLSDNLPTDITKFIEFKSFDPKKLYKSELRVYKPSFLKSMKSKIPRGSHPVRKNPIGYLEAQTRSWVSCLPDETQMQRIEYLKSKINGVKNHHRFFTSNKEDNALLNEAIRQQRFNLA